VGTGAEGVRGVRGGEGRGGDRRRARRVRGRDQGGADGAQDHLHREEGNPRRHMPQRRLHPVQGTAASARISLLCARSVDMDGLVRVLCVRRGACRSVRPRALVFTFAGSVLISLN
jgi:hypothetical protein